jgi:uncharacterized membrane protein
MADREVHIISDRRIAKQASQTEWDTVAHDMQKVFDQVNIGTLHLMALNKLQKKYWQPIFRQGKTKSMSFLISPS